MNLFQLLQRKVLGLETLTPPEPPVATAARVLANRKGVAVLDASTCETPAEVLAALGGAIPSGAALLSGVNTFTSTAQLDLSASTVSMPIILPGTTSIQGIRWANSGDATTLGYETTQHKLRITSKKRVDILPSQDFQGDGFIQLGNNGGTGEYVFISASGTADATRTRVHSHRFALNTSWWNGSAAVNKTSVIRATVDASGNQEIGFFPAGSTASASLVSGWYDVQPGTEMVAFTTSGARINGTLALPETSTNSASAITWGTPGNGNNVSFRGSSQEMILSSRERVAIVCDQRFAGTGFIQLGNNGPTSEIVFISQEGSASASVVNVRSHRLNFNCAWWNGSASQDRRSTVQATTDASGNGVLEFFPTGTNTTGSYNAGTARYDYSDGTRILGLHSSGLRTIRTANTAPAYSFDTSTTTGMGCDTGGTLYFTRSGTAFMWLDGDAALGVVVNQALTCSGRVQLSAGSSGFNALCRTGDTTTGLHFPSAQTIAFQTNGTTRLTLSNAGVIVPTSTPASASATGTTGAITWDADYIYVCTATNTWRRAALSTW